MSPITRLLCPGSINPPLREGRVGNHFGAWGFKQDNIRDDFFERKSD